MQERLARTAGEAGVTQSVSPYEQRNDRFGYAVYSVVVFADGQIQKKVQNIRNAVAIRRSMMPAHITVKGTFCRISNLDETRKVISDIAAATDPVEIVFQGGANQAFVSSDSQSGFQGVEITPELKSLHMNLFDALTPLTTLAYGPEGERYRAHLTVYAEPSPGSGDLANELASSLDLGEGYAATSMCLMGHAGTPYRGQWSIIEEFQFKP